jgi:hypothetical protein
MMVAVKLVLLLLNLLLAVVVLVVGRMVRMVWRAGVRAPVLRGLDASHLYSSCRSTQCGHGRGEDTPEGVGLPRTFGCRRGLGCIGERHHLQPRPASLTGMRKADVNPAPSQKLRCWLDGNCRCVRPCECHEAEAPRSTVGSVAHHFAPVNLPTRAEMVDQVGFGELLR